MLFRLSQILIFQQYFNIKCLLSLDAVSSLISIVHGPKVRFELFNYCNISSICLSTATHSATT